MSFETELIRDGRVVLTTHRGEVDGASVLEAIAVETALTAEHPGVRCIVFDYREASMGPQSEADIARSAAAGAAFLDRFPDVRVVAIVPNPLEFGRTRQFQMRVSMNRTATRPGEVAVVRDADSAWAIVDEVLGRSSGG